MAQYLMREGKEFQWNVWRATSGAIFGIVATSYLHVWWNGLEIVCERIMPSARSKIAHVAVKVLIDQGMGAPMYVYSYYTITNFLQTVAEDNKSPQEAWTECRNKANEMLWPTMFRHWQLWPIVHSFNFYYVPLHHRVLVQNLVLVGWSGCECYVCYVCVSVLCPSRFFLIHLFALTDLSHLNNGGLLTPEKEVEVTVEIKRRETVENKRRETVEIKRRETVRQQEELARKEQTK